MSETIEVHGESYELDDNPSLQTVRDIQSMQMNILLEYVSEDDLRDLDSLEDEGELVQVIIDNEGYDAFQEVMWKNSMLLPVQTVSLACNKAFDTEDFDEMGAKDFQEIREKAEEALDGDASDFFGDLKIGTFMTAQQMRQKA